MSHTGIWTFNCFFFFFTASGAKVGLLLLHRHVCVALVTIRATFNNPLITKQKAKKRRDHIWCIGEEEVGEDGGVAFFYYLEGRERGKGRVLPPPTLPRSLPNSNPFTHSFTAPACHHIKQAPTGYTRAPMRPTMPFVACGQHACISARQIY